MSRAKFAGAVARAIVSLAGFAAAACLGGCDNPACVFDPNGCAGSGGSNGSLGANPASVPVDHEWLQPGAPTITGEFPSTTGVNLDTPLVVTFSESMSSKSLSGALELVASGSTTPVFLLPGALIGDGRMWILFPSTSLTASTSYTVQFTANALVTDLQGQALVEPSDKIVTTFTTAAAATNSPAIVATFPPDAAKNQSPTGEFVVVFDRKVNASSVTSSSFDVTVDGVPPTFDPLPQALLIVSNGVPVTDTRVYRYRSVDNNGDAVDLGQSVAFQASLSPSGHAILFGDGTQLAATKIGYDTASFAAPAAAEIVSLPTNAIGIAQLSGGTTKVGELEIALTLLDGQPSDQIGVFVFGTELNSSPPTLAAFFREFPLSDVPYDANTHIATLKEAQLDLAKTIAPFQARLADGTLNLAFRRRRGSVSSAVRLLDTDPDTSGAQGALLDTKAPTFNGFSTSGSNKTTFRSDLRNFVLVGRANEALSRAEITTALGDNGTLAKVVASGSSGLFVAQPFTQPVFQAPLDTAAGNDPLDFTVTLYDRALNASAPIAATFTQLGGIGAGTPLPGASVTVEVYDASTLLPLANAHVFSHEDFLLTETELDDGFTDANGVVTLSASSLGDTLITVDVAAYDLVTYDAVPTDRISIPLSRTIVASGKVSGILSSSDLAVANLDRTLADTRHFEVDEPTLAIQSCSVNPVTAQLECGFGQYLVRTGQLGAVTATVTDPPTSEFGYSAAGFLKGFVLGIPLNAVNSGQSQNVSLSLPQLLDSPTTPVEQQPIDGPQLTFSGANTNGIDLNSLNGGPRVLLESRTPGLAGDPMVGAAIAFDAGANTWKIRSAYPGVADPTSNKYPGDEQGQLVQDGTIDPDLMLHCELRDTHGARCGCRPRLSNLPSSIDALSAAQLVSPSAGGNTGGEGFDIQFDNVVADALGENAIYRVTLTGSNGRSWRIFGVDPDDSAAAARVHVPDIASFGGNGLPDGAISCSIAAFACPGLDPASYFWSDLNREFDRFSESAPASFTKP